MDSSRKVPPDVCLDKDLLFFHKDLLCLHKDLPLKLKMVLGRILQLVRCHLDTPQS